MSLVVEQASKAKTNPENSSKTCAEQQQPEKLSTGIIRTLFETPIMELVLPARPCLDSSKECSDSGVLVDRNSNGYFESLIKASDPKAEERIKRGEELADKTTFKECLSTAMKWIWQGGQFLSIGRVFSSSLSALLPYGITFTAAGVLDSLIVISRGTSEVNTALVWFGAATVLGLISAVNNVWGRKMEHQHNRAIEQCAHVDIREAITCFSPAKQMTPEVEKSIFRVLMSRGQLVNFGQEVISCVVPLVSVIGAVAIIGTHSPLSALILTAFVPLQILSLRRQGKEQTSTDFGISDAEVRFMTREWNNLKGPSALETVHYNKIDAFIEHLKEEKAKLDKVKHAPILKQIESEFFLKPFNQLVVAALGFTILVDTISGMGPNFSVGTYSILAAALYAANSSFQDLANSIGRVFEKLPSIKSCHGILNEAKEELISANSRKLFRDVFTSNKAARIEVKNLNFSYPLTSKEASKDTQKKDVLKNVSFEVKPGELLGIVGPSGGGKSTLVAIISGLCEAPEGSVFFENNCASSVSSRELWSNSAFLRQKNGNIYSMTIRENINLGAKIPLTDQELLKIAEQTRFAVYMRENGWTLNSVLGSNYEDGIELSGGQQTLLAMTRMQAANSKLIILDEPTANLDPGLTDFTLDRIMSMKDTTRIVISHDYSIASNSDRILVLHSGTVLDIGTHEELYSRCQFYREEFTKHKNRSKKTSQELKPETLTD